MSGQALDSAGNCEEITSRKTGRNSRSIFFSLARTRAAPKLARPSLYYLKNRLIQFTL